ncbi:DUF4350 domain-containing protein [Methanofollis fontis]|uniref:DUF4350 domain-containing protein n=1 Tax=Methanofollis fontis TaxID=2052832 RepID=A0A483CXE9_9EURY|nr:DUF4350 domain-containing protein [Methanofollis fontis]TAJ43933.1 hypothetical protein CUJ86_07705 [Methanofollis fontis]
MLAVAVVFILLVHLSANDLEYSRYNLEWNGTSIVRGVLDGHGASVLVDSDDLLSCSDTLLLMIAPTTSAGDGEVNDIRAFLYGNNTLFIADDSGISNSLLAGIGSKMRIAPGNITGLDTAYRDPSFPKGYQATDHPLVRGIEWVAFNRPAQVLDGEPLLSSGLFSWYDLDGNALMDPGEPSGTFVFIAREDVGGGEVIVCADPSIFINAMQKHTAPEGNRAFVENLVSLKQNVLVSGDNSATERTSAFGSGFVALKCSPYLQAAVLCAVLAAAALVWTRKIAR